MDPTRQTEVNGKPIREYYWAGDWPCYVDNRLVTVAYDEAVRLARNGESIPFQE